MELEFHQLDLRYEALRVRRPERERRLLASLAERGQQVPIVVIALADEPNRFLVIDGYKRIRALQRLGRDTVRATVWDMNETEALILDRSLRTAEGETALEQGWLLSELHRSLGLSLDDLARRFDRSVSWVSRRLALVRELPESVQQHVRNGKIGAQAAMKYLVPIARANRRSCERLAEAIARHQFNTGEVGQIYEAWRKGPIYVQNSILDDPKLFLRARREIEEEDPEGVRAGEELLHNLDIIGAMARRATRQWREAAGTMNHAERENAWLCVQQAIEDLTRLSNKIEKENGYVESESADGNSGASPQGRGDSPDCACAQSIACRSQESNPLAIEHPPANCSSRESGAVPAGDPGTLCLLQGKPGPSP
ncbi:MAG: ParB N-terminal domain-containing protein [Acidobacteria bacterium]|nr:ParB N-terminal domain-containing protein [Acidobacteriota bacterium]